MRKTLLGNNQIFTQSFNTLLISFLPWARYCAETSDETGTLTAWVGVEKDIWKVGNYETWQDKRKKLQTLMGARHL